jgi:hypothetical protein
MFERAKLGDKGGGKQDDLLGDPIRIIFTLDNLEKTGFIKHLGEMNEKMDRIYIYFNSNRMQYS